VGGHTKDNKFGEWRRGKFHGHEESTVKFPPKTEFGSTIKCPSRQAPTGDIAVRRPTQTHHGAWMVHGHHLEPSTHFSITLKPTQGSSNNTILPASNAPFNSTNQRKQLFLL
jgi:hypothetical protein